MKLFPFVIVAVLASTADAGSVWKGTAYENPDRWKEQDQGDNRILVAPSRAGEVLVVIVTGQFKLEKTPAIHLEALVRTVEKAATKVDHSAPTTSRTADFTMTAMTSRVEDAALGTSNRIYELVSNSTDAVFVAVVSKGDASLADQRKVVTQILASWHPTTTAAQTASDDDNSICRHTGQSAG